MTEHGKRTITTIIEDEITDSSLRIPISPYIHPAGVNELAQLGIKYKNNLANIAMMLVCLLKQREQNNIVSIPYADLIKNSGMSDRTLSTTMQQLIKHQFITKVGKQSYKISPKLAWFGNQVDWAVALQELEQNTQNEDKQNDKLVR